MKVTNILPGNPDSYIQQLIGATYWHITPAVLAVLEKAEVPLTWDMQGTQRLRLHNVLHNVEYYNIPREFSEKALMGENIHLIHPNRTEITQARYLPLMGKALPGLRTIELDLENNQRKIVSVVEPIWDSKEIQVLYRSTMTSTTEGYPMVFSQTSFKYDLLIYIPLSYAGKKDIMAHITTLIEDARLF